VVVVLGGLIDEKDAASDNQRDFIGRGAEGGGDGSEARVRMSRYRELQQPQCSLSSAEHSQTQSSWQHISQASTAISHP
jgi:hypothetical protein